LSEQKVAGTFCAKHPQCEFLAKGTGHFFTLDPIHFFAEKQIMFCRWPSGHHFVAMLIVMIYVSSGCSQKELTELTDRVKTATVDKIEEIKPAIPMALKTGQFRLTIDAPVETQVAQISLLQIGDGRRNVLQLRSYKELGKDSGPAVFYQAAVSADSVGSLVGQSVSGKMFVRGTAGGKLWSSVDEAPVTLTIEAIDGEELVGSVTSGTLVGTTGATTAVSGSFRAIISKTPGSESALVIRDPASLTAGNATGGTQR